MNKFMEAIDTLKSWIGSCESLDDKQVWAPKWAHASEFGTRKKRKYTKKKKPVKKPVEPLLEPEWKKIMS